MNTDPIAASVALSADTLRVSLSDAVLGTAAFLPKAALALVLVAAGAGLAALAGMAVQYIIASLGLDTLSERSGFAKALRFFGDKLTLSKAGEYIARIAFIAAFALAAVRVLGFTAAVDFAAAVLAYVPRVSIALLSLLLGFAAAEAAVWLMRRFVALLSIPIGSPAALALLVRAGLVTLGAFGSLTALGVPDSFINIVFIAAAAAAALAFGLGGRDRAAAFLERESPKK